MISAWWLLLITPFTYLVGHVMGVQSGMSTLKFTCRTVRRLLMANNVPRAIRLLDVAEGIQNKVQQKTFEDKLKELDK